MELHSIEEIRAIVTMEMVQVCRRYMSLAATIGVDFRDLLFEIEQLITHGGKRLRPYLAYLSYVGRGGTSFEDVLPVLVSVEFCHLFLLIHDDCVDHDYIRHGRSNIAGRYLHKTGSESQAAAAALLAGDVVYGMSMSCLDDLYLRNMLEKSVFRTVGGEVLDVFGSAGATRHKTADYSFQLPLSMGAYTAGAMTDVQSFALPLGIAYQLRDDWLGMFGSEKLLGKSVTTDLREGKVTLLYAHAYEFARGADRDLLLRLHGSAEVTEDDVRVMCGVYERCGAVQALEQDLDRHSTEALAALPSLGYANEISQILATLVVQLTKREK